jgi:hypothetical protein
VPRGVDASQTESSGDACIRSGSMRRSVLSDDPESTVEAVPGRSAGGGICGCGVGLRAHVTNADGAASGSVDSRRTSPHACSVSQAVGTLTVLAGEARLVVGAGAGRSNFTARETAGGALPAAGTPSEPGTPWVGDGVEAGATSLRKRRNWQTMKLMKLYILLRVCSARVAVLQ